MQIRPIVVFEHVINDRLYRFEVMNGAPYGDAFAVLDEFKKSLETAKLESEKIEAEKKIETSVPEQSSTEQPASKSSKGK